MDDKNKYQIDGLENPFILQRADPWIYRHENGFYYFTASVPEYERIELRCSATLAGLVRAEPKILWRKHESGAQSKHIWAPEIHFLDGKWYIYYAAGRAEDIWNIEKYVLECPDEDPMEGAWSVKGIIRTGESRFTLDATIFEHLGRRFMVWAQKPDEDPDVSNLMIAEMETPWSIKGKPVLLSRPEYPWETILFDVNEGPAVLIKNGMIYLTYSASGTDHNYCMGLLTARAESDPLDPGSWTKSKEPVFRTSGMNGIYGPGHSCFLKDEDGESDLLVYHARDYKEIQGNPLNDPNRHTRIQRIFWDENNMPLFGEPIPNTKKIVNPDLYH
ncbi:MAG: glycoside hydrolase family 43 protein [Spirochaetales bacterium]|nr:glycoside hydrolase family 43 protein [Spirochaetales bacterium]